eukprot:TRINITY_DN4062_c0_g1_i1.p1 TRINITY_DN4062_c0_g1~~TRINITY_DN4062_c0_g1_i1.p1  ORF type:complete len:446 (-),score=157.60 TRINITY_DN4062_c0_g1_i1:72-1409(-)
MSQPTKTEPSTPQTPMVPKTDYVPSILTPHSHSAPYIPTPYPTSTPSSSSSNPKDGREGGLLNFVHLARSHAQITLPAHSRRNTTPPPSSSTPSSSSFPLPSSNSSNLNLNSNSNPNNSSSDLSWVIDHFAAQLRSDSELAAAVAAIRVLTQVIQLSHASTMYELQLELRDAASRLTSCSTSISLSSASALFLTFITRSSSHPSSTSSTDKDFLSLKSDLLSRSISFTSKAILSRSIVSNLAETFVSNNLVILTLGFSRVVLGVLEKAMGNYKRFRVIVAESRPDCAGVGMARVMAGKGMEVTVIPDVGIAAVMEKVDFVMVGCEAVVENGGIINRIGTYGCAVIAKEMKKPFYVACESFKFTRLYPLNQSDLPSTRKVDIGSDGEGGEGEKNGAMGGGAGGGERYRVENPQIDYTPPKYLTLLFTDLGVLTPSAVSDELIKLYY